MQVTRLRAGASRRCVITVGLVNNMPDSAFVGTEEQFRRCLNAVPDGISVELELYTVTEIQRSPAIASVIQSRYGGLHRLFSHPPDALIVTGTEPTRSELPSEPSWPYIARVLEWAADNVPTTMLSCLAAHAFVLLFDGIERVPREVKASGVYEGVVENRHDPLVPGLPTSVVIPHSRLNDVPEAELVRAGYNIVIGSGRSGVGWALATRRRRNGLFVLCQGHPEYGTLSLLREYRRDVRRWLFGESSRPYPRAPTGYLTPQASECLEQFADWATAGATAPELLWESFPFDDVAQSIENTWAATASTLYGNWMGAAVGELPLAA